MTTNVAVQATEFSISDTNSFVPVVTLSIQDHAKLLKQLKSRLKKTINWNKYQSKMLTERQNQYLDYLIDPSFQGITRLFVLVFQNEAQRISHRRYYFPTVEIKNCNVMINGQNFFNQLVRNNLIT